MIRVNQTTIAVGHFPDGSQLINIKSIIDNFGARGFADFEWYYENDEEYMTLLYILKQVRQGMRANAIYRLFLPYVPNARMDRVKNPGEVFTLKWFVEAINSMNFDIVYVFDNHSDVSSALINNIIIASPKKILEYLFREEYDNGIDGEFDGDNDPNHPTIFFPDAGAMKRYSSLFPHNKVIYGDKVREWETGKILGLTIKAADGTPLEKINGDNILLVDDIIAYGGTMFHSATKLKELGAGELRIYCSHLENSFVDEEKGTLRKLLESGTVSKLYTTNSIWRSEFPNVKVMKLNPFNLMGSMPAQFEEEKSEDKPE